MAELIQTPPAPLGLELRTLREAKGWSRRTLADRSATSEASIARTELYGHTPKVTILSRWADALDVSVADLLKVAA
jgi:transcriptional regulator with XRE-family HTH domain